MLGPRAAARPRKRHRRAYPATSHLGRCQCMTVSLKSLRVSADLDSGNYVWGARAINDANRAMGESARAVAEGQASNVVAFQRRETAITGYSRATQRLVAQLDPVAREELRMAEG